MYIFLSGFGGWDFGFHTFCFWILALAVGFQIVPLCSWGLDLDFGVRILVFGFVGLRSLFFWISNVMWAFGFGAGVFDFLTLGFGLRISFIWALVFGCWIPDVGFPSHYML